MGRYLTLQHVRRSPCQVGKGVRKMKAIITSYEVVGKQKAWVKVNIVNVVTGEAANGLVAVANFDPNLKVTKLEDYENDADVDFQFAR